MYALNTKEPLLASNLYFIYATHAKVPNPKMIDTAYYNVKKTKLNNGNPVPTI